MTPLEQAARDGDLERTRRLVSGAAPAGELCSALGWAAEYGRTDVVVLLLSSGVDVNCRQAQGWTALHLAASSRDVPMMALLLQHGADVNSGDERGVTPLHVAVDSVIDEAIARTDDAGSWVPPSPDVPLLLLAHGADPNARDDRGGTPLDGAAEQPGAAPLARLLRDHGARDSSNT